MLPNVTYKNLKNVSFPVYVLPSDEVDFIDGLLLFENKVIDDRNMPGDTLGKRRLQTPHKLLRFKKLCPNLAAMLASKGTNFIDTRGNAFRYNKTKYVSLKCKKIKKVQRKEVASILWAVGVDTPFAIPRPPPAGNTWVSILYFGDYPWQLYEYSETKLPDRRKKI